VRDALRVKHYAYSTEESYVQWIRRYILFHHKRHPNEMAEPEVEAFLTHLAIKDIDLIISKAEAPPSREALLLCLISITMAMVIGTIG
jgi:hypothetical protein